MCKQCKRLIQKDLEKITHEQKQVNNKRDVKLYKKIKGKIAFQVENFVIFEEPIHLEERKAKTAAKKAVASTMKRPPTKNEVFNAVSKKPVKKYRYNSNAGSYNSIISVSDSQGNQDQHEDQKSPAKKQHIKTNITPQKPLEAPSAYQPIFWNPYSPPMPGYYPGAIGMPPQAPQAIPAQPSVIFVQDPRYFIQAPQPNSQSYPTINQNIQHNNQQLNVYFAPPSYTMTPFTYYSMPYTGRPAEYPPYKPYLFMPVFFSNRYTAFRL